MPLRRCLDYGRTGCAGWSTGSLCGPCRSRRKARRNADAPIARAVAAGAAVCCLCGGPPTPDDPLTLEHKVPVSAGGSSTSGNVGAAHRSCNSRKRDR